MWQKIKSAAQWVAHGCQWLGSQIVRRCRWLGGKLGFSAITAPSSPAAVPVRRSAAEEKSSPSPPPNNIEILLPDVNNIILGYVHGDTAETEYPYQRSLSFFDNATLRISFQAARHILCGNSKAALALVEQNPHILDYPLNITDDRGRELKGKTIFQIAAMAGDFNLRDKTADEKEDHGLVERLSSYLSKEEVIKQLGVVFPPGWKKEMEKRTQLILDELKQFSEELIKLTAAELLEIQRLKNANEPVPLIKRFRNALLAHSRKVIETGYIFDPQIFVAAIQFFEANVDRFGDWYNDKSDLFWVHGFGLLQDLAAACDLQVIKSRIFYTVHNSGIYYPAQQKKAVDRDFNFSTGRPAILSGLGSSFYLDIFGHDTTLDDRWGEHRPADRATFPILISGKNISAAKLMQREQHKLTRRFSVR